MKNNHLTRQEKIKILQAIKDGKLHPDTLKGQQVYFFYEDSRQPGVYTGPGGRYTQQQYDDFCEVVKRRNENAVVWHECKTYEDKIITFRVQPGNEPLEEMEV